MPDIPIDKRLLEQLRKLKADEQQQVLDFIGGMQDSSPKGMPGNLLLEWAQELDFDPADLDEMKQAIEEGCEGIDWGEW